jgi:hypothetical protein
VNGSTSFRHARIRASANQLIWFSAVETCKNRNPEDFPV